MNFLLSSLIYREKLSAKKCPLKTGTFGFLFMKSFSKKIRLMVFAHLLDACAVFAIELYCEKKLRTNNEFHSHAFKAKDY